MAPWNRKCIAALAVAVVSSLLFSSTLLAGKLNAVRKSAKGTKSVSNKDDDDDDDKPKKRKRKHKRQRNQQYDDDDHHSSPGLSIDGTVLFQALISPWLAPAQSLGDDYSDVVDFSRYPYADGHDGYIVIEPPSEASHKGFGLRYSTEYANDFSGLERIGGRLQLENVARFGIDTEWNRWREQVPGGDDTLWTGDANLTFRFAQNEHAQFYTGLGMNWLGGGQTDVGFNFTYGFDWFPTEPFVIRSVLDMGTIGDADLYHSKTTIGLVYKHLELYTGYDIINIGDTNLQGMIGGLTIWW